MVSVEKAVTIRYFETSAARIEKAEWMVPNPITNGELLSNDGAQSRVGKAPVRDKRKNFDDNRFRILFIQLQTQADLGDCAALLQAAKASHWISSEFVNFTDKGTAGSAVLTSTENVGFFLQTPGDDGLPFVALSITQVPTEGHHGDADWVCLLFTTPEVRLDALLCTEPFPSDYSPLSPDFMFFPAAILKWQVEKTREGVVDLLKEVIDGEKAISIEPFDVASIKRRLFERGKRHLKLRHRWLFEQKLAEDLIRCFLDIARLQQADVTGGTDAPLTYSKILRQRIQTQISLSNTLKHDLDTIPSKIAAQHQLVDARLNILIAQNSAIAAEESRRDSSSMKTIATLTLVFLPATFIATIFSMSTFNWEAKASESTVSTRGLWLYFVIAAPLTLIVLAIWVFWYKRTQRKWSNQHGNGMEMIAFPDAT